MLRGRFSELNNGLMARDAGMQNDLTEQGMSLRQGKQEHNELSAEIGSLKARRSNIPAEQVAMRAVLCKALDLSEGDTPFAGELLQVRDDVRAWEGAAERLLRNFGLSLLVPDEHYAEVVDWVDRTHLRGRLVYFRIRQSSRGELPAMHRDSLARKLAIKPDSPFYDWLEREVAHRFDVACCATQEQFRREIRAITRAGQIKASGERHEKETVIDWMTAVVMCWDGPTRQRSPRSKLKRGNWRRVCTSWAAASAKSKPNRMPSRIVSRHCRNSTSTLISANSTAVSCRGGSSVDGREAEAGVCFRCAEATDRAAG